MDLPGTPRAAISRSSDEAKEFSMSQHPYRYSEDPMLNSGLVPGRDVEEDKATSAAERDAPYRVPLNRPMPPFEGTERDVPRSKPWFTATRARRS
jgi:hypothetical protein